MASIPIKAGHPREDQARYNISVPPAPLDLDSGEGAMLENQHRLACGETLHLDVDEKILLHGTSRENAASIAMHGFDHRTCKSGMYGDGVYFAGAACKTHQYSCSTRCGLAHCRCKRTLIIARVALGDAYHTDSTLRKVRKPPQRQGAEGTHGSILAKPGAMTGHHNKFQVHQEFVIFDGDQAYPAFVVQYELNEAR